MVTQGGGGELQNDQNHKYMYKYKLQSQALCWKNHLESLNTL